MNGPQFPLKGFHEALLSAFPRRALLAQLLKLGMGESLEAIAGSGPLEDVAFAVIEWAESRGRLGELLQAALDANSSNPHLKELASFASPMSLSSVLLGSKANVDAIEYEAIPSLTELADRLGSHASLLLAWPRLIRGKHRITLAAEDQLCQILGEQSSSTLVLGAKGTGKSALLAEFGNTACKRGMVVVAIKADRLPASIHSATALGDWLGLSIDPVDAIRRVAGARSVLVLIRAIRFC